MIIMLNQNNAWSASFYESMQHQPNHAFVIASYAVFKSVVLRQWEELREGGIEFVPSPQDPYLGSHEMMNEVRNHLRLKVFTDNGASLPDDHPMKERINAGIDGFEVLNDVFRGVHDIMGHVVSGGSFGPNGEKVAWESHRRTMPKAAHNALWCETRGQNAWTNFAHDHPTRPIAERPFGEQKSGLVPFFLAS